MEDRSGSEAPASPGGPGAGGRRRVYVTLHRNLVREGIGYVDRETGERRTFNVARLPAGCEVGGRDVGGYEFSPLYVDPARFEDPGEYRDIPLLADREVRLSRSVLGAGGEPVLDGDGRRVKDVLSVTPQELRDAVRAAAARARGDAARDGRGLSERADAARGASGALPAPRTAAPEGRRGPGC